MRTEIDRILGALVPDATSLADRNARALGMASRCFGYTIIMLAFIGCFLSLEP